MGEVYRAQDTRLRRVVALKTLSQRLESNPQAIERFEREARAAASLNHPNICTIYDVGTDPPFIAMELLEGETLQQRLRRGPMDVMTVVDVTLGLVDALEAAHAQGILHRDIKPANIFLTGRGPKILDFGLAKAVPASAESDGTGKHEQADRVAAHRRGNGGRNGGLHVTGAAPWPAPRRENRSLFARAGAVRDGNRPPGVRRRNQRGHRRRDSAGDARSAPACSRRRAGAPRGHHPQDDREGSPGSHPDGRRAARRPPAVQARARVRPDAGSRTGRTPIRNRRACSERRSAALRQHAGPRRSVRVVVERSCSGLPRSQ